MAAAPARAETNTENTHLVGTNTFYAYAAAGERVTADFVFPTTSATRGQTFTLRDPSGTERWACSIDPGAPTGQRCTAPAHLTGPAGVWILDITGLGPQVPNWPEGTGHDTNWNITVTTADDAVIPGRVWTKQYRAYNRDWTTGGLGVAHPEFWVVSENGTQYKVELTDFDGRGWTVSSDAFGNVVPAGSCTPAYKSLVNTQNSPEHPSPGPQCGPSYSLFFNAPADDLPATATSAEGSVYVKPDYVAATLTGAEYTRTNELSHAGALKYDQNNFTGNSIIRIDANGNGVYTDAVDLSLPQSGTDGSKTLDWNGRDANGTEVDRCTSVNFQVAIEKTDEIHFVLGDAEAVGGLEITQLVGASVGRDVIYWDDTDVPQAGGNPKATTTDPIVNLTGISSAGGTHSWHDDRIGNPWGNYAAIDNWTFSPVDITAETTSPTTCVSISKASNATVDTRIGDHITYTVTARNDGDSDFTEANPVFVSDDLTGVLDDAEYNLDASADRPGTTAYSEPKISWTGALAEGDTVTLTYTVTITAAGDGVARNVAYAGASKVPTPACNPPEDGKDRASGTACAENELQLPRLTVEKSVDVTDTSVPPADAETVTYTVTVTNIGPGDYTDTAPARVSDDLSDVLDDAEFTEILQPAGEDLFDPVAKTIGWSGPLAASASMVIEYAVTYDSSLGDNVLYNIACIPERQTAPGAESCADVQLPSAAPDEVETLADPLASTGGRLAISALTTGLLLLAAGGLLLHLRRRR